MVKISIINIISLAVFFIILACSTLMACSVSSNVNDDINIKKLATVQTMYQTAIESEKSDALSIIDLQIIYENSNDELKNFITKVKRSDYETNDCAYEGINTLKLVAGNGLSVSDFDSIDYQLSTDGLVQVNMKKLDTGVNGEVGTPLSLSTEFELSCESNTCNVSDIILDGYSVIGGLRRFCS